MVHAVNRAGCRSAHLPVCGAKIRPFDEVLNLNATHCCWQLAEQQGVRCSNRPAPLPA